MKIYIANSIDVIEKFIVVNIYEDLNGFNID